MKTFYIDPSEIFVSENRFRKKFDPKKLQQLKESISDCGQIQPGVVVTLEDGTYSLVAGERRLRACTELGIEYLAILREDITDPGLLLQIELEENLRRSDLSPQEEVLAKARIHELLLERSSQEGAWRPQSMTSTAEELGVSTSGLSEDLRLAKLVDIIPGMAEAKTKSEMKKLEKKFIQTGKWHIQTKEAEKKSEERLKEAATPTGEEPKTLSLHEQKAAQYIDNIRVGDALEELADLPNASVNLIIWDPPWGVNLNQKLRETTHDKTGYTDSPDAFAELFPVACQELFRVLAKDSHLYCFFGIVHHNFVYQSLEDAGFEVNRRPLIWCKTGAKSTRQPEKWPGAGYEPIAFARKGSRALIKKGSDWIEEKPLTVTDKMGHPSAKPPELYLELLKRSAYPGDTVVDPMYGSGNVFVACEMIPELKLNWYGWDLSKQYRDAAVANIIKTFLS